MKGLLALSKGIDTFTEWTGRIAYFIVPLVVGVGIYNVATRYIGRAINQVLGSNLYIELQWYLFGIICMLGAAYNLKHNEHVRVDVLYGSWDARRKAWVNLIGSAVILIPFCALFFYFSWPYVSQSWRIFESSPDPGGLPRYPIKSLLLIWPSLLIIQAISEIIKNAAFLGGHIQSVEAKSEASAL